MTASRHSARAARALAHLTEADPAISVLALWCSHRDGDRATHTKGETIWYGPEFDALALPEAVGLAAHQILHVALRHSARLAEMHLRQGSEFDASLWSAVADGLINDLLLEAGHALPRPALRASEMVTAGFGTTPTPAQVLSDWDSDRLYVALRRGGTGLEGDPDAKARAYAARRGHEPDIMAENGGTDAGTSGQDWEARLSRALAAGRTAGTGIGTVGAALAELAPPRVPWEVLLRRLLSRAILDQPAPSTARPARRWIARDADARRNGSPQPAFEPGSLRQTDQPRIVIALDTSGSVSRDSLALFAGETVGIERRLQAELHLLAFDTEVQTLASPLRGDLRKTLSQTPFREGGGTDFAPALAHATTLAPSAIVVLTDLEGPTGADPGCPVYWLCESAPSSAPAFGTVLLTEA